MAAPTRLGRTSSSFPSLVISRGRVDEQHRGFKVNRLKPTGSFHLSRVDFIAVVLSLKICATMRRDESDSEEWGECWLLAELNIVI